MAIDTENKRRSTQGIWAIQRVLPVPDTTVDASDREHIWLYSGIAADFPVIVTPVEDRRHRRYGGFRRRG